MLTFAEEIILLLLDPEDGTLGQISTVARSATLAGAVLMDLAERSKIDTDLEHLVVVDGTPTGEAVLDLVLSKIVAESQPHDTEYWLEEAFKFAPEIERRAFAHLTDRKILAVEIKSDSSVQNSKRYRLVDADAERELTLRLLTVIYGDSIPAPRDIALVCLADASSMFELVLSGREMKRVAARIEQIRKLDMIGHLVANTIESVRKRMANAIGRMTSSR